MHPMPPETKLPKPKRLTDEMILAVKPTPHPKNPHKTRAGVQKRRNAIKDPVLPKAFRGMSVEEIAALDPADPRFKLAKGAPRKYPDEGEGTTKHLTFGEVQKTDRVRRERKRKRKARKAEVIVAATARDARTWGKIKQEVGSDPANGLTIEARMIQEGLLDLDDWDDEELARGYRRNRRGKFGRAPMYIPRDVQQEAFRRLVKRGEQRIRESYLTALDTLAELSVSARSDNVRLQASNSIIERVMGKVPTRIVQEEQSPWEHMLVDSVEFPQLPEEASGEILEGEIIEDADEVEDEVERFDAPAEEAAPPEPVPIAAIVAPSPPPTSEPFFAEDDEDDDEVPA